jgi:mannose-1-phosphate guanylyltransferase
MNDRTEPWSIVLAGGEGARLRPLMAEAYGVEVPKQYCAFNGDVPLVRLALRRALQITSSSRVVTVVSADHRRWWETQLADQPHENIVVQPCNRGTACGILLPLIHILLQDPRALIAVLPSDHFVADEAVLTRTLRKAVRVARRAPDSFVLLGIPPEGFDNDFGWIEPTLKTQDGVHWVLSFVEKPVPEVAEQLRDRGFLLNSFVFVARGLALLEAYSRAFPNLVERFGSVWFDRNADETSRHLESLYADLPSLDLSRDLLQSNRERLRVLPVPPCGWTDLGTPERVARCLERVKTQPSLDRTQAGGSKVPLDLAAAVARNARGSSAHHAS